MDHIREEHLYIHNLYINIYCSHRILFVRKINYVICWRERRKNKKISKKKTLKKIEKKKCYINTQII